MPTFETDSPKPPRKGEEADSTQEFRPRRRDQRRGRGRGESFTPASIPEAVKKGINERIGDLVRQSKGPDEKMFALREGVLLFQRIWGGFKDWCGSLFSREEDEEQGDFANSSTAFSSSGEKTSGNRYSRRRRRGPRRKGRRRN